MGAYWVLFGIFVVLAEVLRRDAIKEGVDPRPAFFIGLFFGGVSTVVSLILIAVLT